MEILLQKDGAAAKRKSASFITNWVNNCPDSTWNNGMDPSQRQVIVPAAPMGGGAPPPTDNNDNITILE